MSMKKRSARQLSTSKAKILQPLLIILFLIIYFGASVFFKLFTIQNIHCQKAGTECDEPVLAEFNRLQGKFFFTPRISQTIDKILRSDPYISEIKVERTFPHTISFQLQKKSPHAEISCQPNSLLINDDGKIEENTRNLHLEVPSIPTNQTLCESFLSQGSIDLPSVDALMSFSQVVAKDAPDHTMEWSDVSTVVVLTPTHQKIILPTNQLERAFQMYRYLLDQNQLQEGWKELDLRFQKAIVKTE